MQLRLDLDHDVPSVMADLAQINQVVMNLVINGAEAVEEGRDGAVVVTVRQQTFGCRIYRANPGRRRFAAVITLFLVPGLPQSWVPRTNNWNGVFGSKTKIEVACVKLKVPVQIQQPSETLSNETQLRLSISAPIAHHWHVTK